MVHCDRVKPRKYEALGPNFPELPEKPLAYCLFGCTECRLNSTCLPQTVYYERNDQAPHSRAVEVPCPRDARTWNPYFRRTAERVALTEKTVNARTPPIRSRSFAFVIECSQERLEMPESGKLHSSPFNPYLQCNGLRNLPGEQYANR